MKNRNLIIALVVLVLLNIISLGFLWYTNRQHFDRLPARQLEVNFRFFKEIDFDEQQQKTGSVPNSVSGEKRLSTEITSVFKLLKVLIEFKICDRKAV